MNDLQRTLMTISCRDAEAIPKVPDAGRMATVNGERVQIMHNGLKVVYGGYYGEWTAQIIRALRGHHEPQEERLFEQLLRYVRNGSLMVELGSYWAYYSLWFLHEIPDSTAFCVEPDANYMSVGVHNARLNKMSDRIRFRSAWAGSPRAESFESITETSTEAICLPVWDFDAVWEQVQQPCIELLHLDIQGMEAPFLRSIDPRLDFRRIRFLMVSTHHRSISGSSATHGECLKLLEQMGATILQEYSVGQSYSGDGLILASLYPEDRGLWFPSISRNQPSQSLFFGID